MDLSASARLARVCLRISDHHDGVLSFDIAANVWRVGDEESLAREASEAQ